MFEGEAPNTQTLRFLNDNFNWVKSQANSRYGTDDYWLSIQGIVRQLEGFLDGFTNGCPCQGSCSSSSSSYWTMDNPTIMHLLLLNADGDLYQVTEKFFSGSRRLLQKRRNRDESRPTATKQLRKDNHCSALFKLLPNNSDIIFGHTTWDTFESAAPRIMKQLRLHLFTRSRIIQPNWNEYRIGLLESISNSGPTAVTKATKQSRWEGKTDQVADYTYSSSPGFLASIDDFYIISGAYGHLAVIETSLDIYSQPVINQISSQSVLCWMRAIVANTMASSGVEWSSWFSLFHSGTYVNQWMILDLNKFQSKDSPLTAGLFTVLEEMPGKVHSEDKTAHLEVSVHVWALTLFSFLHNQEFGYWASYNLPYFPDINYYSGAEQFCEADPLVVSTIRFNAGNIKPTDLAGLLLY
jgi:hypothetical protein